jgi:hypothetical protein
MVVENPQIADRLDAFASLLELVEANPYTARAYRRAADTLRVAAVPVVELVRSGRVRELPGIGAGIEARLRELIETGDIVELAELERQVSPGLVGLGRYLGLGPKRSIELARSLGVRTAEEFRLRRRAGWPPRRGSDRRSRRDSSSRCCARSRSAASRRPSLGSKTSAATCTATRRGRTDGRASRRWPAPLGSTATNTSRSAITRRP